MALVALASPRLALFLIWAFDLFGGRMSAAFDSFWIGFAGFVLLPWTTLTWTATHDPLAGVRGFGWFLVGIAFVADVVSYLKGDHERRQREILILRRTD
ncbi:MAG: hypothetical protein N2037_05325 [Acidimicrobiales bacterium]|nr:hypothetical protein [Acidimicrobiales bacterium]